MRGDPFHIESPPNAPCRRAALASARPFLSWLLRLDTYRALYEQAREVSDGPFEQRALQVLDIRVTCVAEDIAAIPARGPLVVAANHPLGGLDGLVLAALVKGVRPDVRLLVNHLLAGIPELADLCFFVDPFGGRGAAARSQAGLRAAYRWVRRGGALVVFPAGEVAHQSRADGSYADSPWHPIIGRIARWAGAPVVPALIAGKNSALFYAAGRLHSACRTALLPRELLKQRGRSVCVRLGHPIAARDLAACADATATTAAIRSAVEQLADRPALVTLTVRPADAIASEVARLPQEACLVESGSYRVFCVKASQIPSALQEIGRLRETTYRAIGEGTGREVDLDAFDEQYLHLFLWDGEHKQIVGAYRIGRTDHIMAADGVRGLYTRTLFRYDERLIRRMSPALELGRSFVRAEYQRNYSALLLLWKGIGQFVVKHPEYRVLFGPVSISTRYSDRSHQLLMAFLEQNHLDRALAELADAINPRMVDPAPLTAAVPRSIDDANRLVSQMEPDGKGVPVLLRQYLKLNARLIGFSVDPNFGDALDALMMVDLTSVARPILERYLGRDGAAQFLAHHRCAVRPQTAA